MRSVKSHTVLLIQLFNKKENKKEVAFFLWIEKYRKSIQIYANIPSFHAVFGMLDKLQRLQVFSSKSTF